MPLYAEMSANGGGGWKSRPEHFRYLPLYHTYPQFSIVKKEQPLKWPLLSGLYNSNFLYMGCKRELKNLL